MIRPFCRVVTVVCISLALVIVSPLRAEAEEQPQVGGLVRLSIMVPVLDKHSGEIQKIAPVMIDIHATTDDAKNFLTDRMASIQDAYMMATYGKVNTDTGYDQLIKIIQSATDRFVGDDYKGQYTIDVRVNVRKQ